MGSRAAMQALVPGRVVLVTNRSTGLPELGAICGAPASPSKGIQLGDTASSGKQTILAFHRSRHSACDGTSSVFYNLMIHQM